MMVDPASEAESARERSLIETARRRAASVTGSRGAGSASAAADLPHFPGYTVVREADRGGQGVVYEALQESTGRAVAIKLLRGGAFASPSSRARLEREVRLLAQLDHEGVCPVIDFFSEADHLFCVMPFLFGENLARRVARAGAERDGGATLEAAWDVIVGDLGGERGRAGVLHLIEDLARTVHVVNERGIVHRDLKPGNVMLRAGRRPVVLDFGLALELDEDEAARFTPDDEPVGTPAYMAPEQIEQDGVAVDRRADVYALGALLYEVLTLRRAFRGKGLVEVCGNIAHGRFDTPRTLEPEIPPDLQAVCLQAMATDPAQRYATTLELALDLARARRGEATVARPLSKLEHGLRFLRRHKVLVAAGLIVAAALSFALTRPAPEDDPLDDLLTSGSSSALEIVWAALADPLAGDLLAFEPADGAELETWLDGARARFSAQASEAPHIELLRPRAGVLDDTPDFVLRVPPAASQESDYARYELRLFDGARELRTLSVTQYPGEGSTLNANLDAADRLASQVDYGYTVELRGRRFDPAAGLALATFRVVDPAELGARLERLPRTASPAALGLGRAAVMLSLDLAGEARDELARLPAGLSPAEVVRRELLSAWAAALVADEAAVTEHAARALAAREESL